MKEEITIHPAEDITGRYWAYVNENGKEVGSDNRDKYSLCEAKERVKLKFGQVEISVNGKILF